MKNRKYKYLQLSLEAQAECSRVNEMSDSCPATLDTERPSTATWS